MAISENKHRFLVLLEKEVLEKFKELAKKEHRSASNLATKLISDYVDKNDRSK